MRTAKGWLVLVCGVTLAMLAGYSPAVSQEGGQMVRLAKLGIDPAQLQAYEAALKEEVEASLRLEPGVRTLFAVAEKDRPTQFTILEIYESRAAYEAHIKTPHFLKYKTGTAQMVKSLELVEVSPLFPEMKASPR